MIDEYRNEHIVRVLVEGAQFGEIGVAYNCKRTATVLTRNYNTLARLSKERYNEMIGTYPEYQSKMLRSIYGYKQSRKKFYFKIASRI